MRSSGCNRKLNSSAITGVGGFHEEAQFDMLANTYPEVADAVQVIKDLSADEEFRYGAYLAEKAKRDWLSSLDSAMYEGLQKGRQEGELRMSRTARMLRDSHIDMSIIVASTGLSEGEISQL